MKNAKAFIFFLTLSLWTLPAMANQVEDFLLWCDIRSEYSVGNGFGIPYSRYGYKNQYSAGTGQWEGATYRPRPYVFVQLGCRFADPRHYGTPAHLINQHIAPTIFYFEVGQEAQRDHMLRLIWLKGTHFAISIRAIRSPFLTPWGVNNPDAFNLHVVHYEIW